MYKQNDLENTAEKKQNAKACILLTFWKWKSSRNTMHTNLWCFLSTEHIQSAFQVSCNKMQHIIGK